MLEKLIYRNHINETFGFGSEGIYVNTSDLHDYEWTVTKTGNKISNLSHGVTKKSIPVIVICPTEEEAVDAVNKLMEITEKDCLTMEYGKLIINGYYLRCYVTKSAKKKYLTNKRYMEITLTLQTDYPYWVKEITVPFRAGASSGGGGSADEDDLDYPYDFPHDFYADAQRTSLFNPSFMPSNFRMIIYGECEDPTISIAGHTYQVNVTVDDDEYIIIDSTAKTIQMIGSNGAATNVFNDRNKESYIFEKIPAGNSSVIWDGSFGFDIILLEERSEPKWI